MLYMFAFYVIIAPLVAMFVQPDVTVDGLLRSLGLEKYSIQFQAEEVLFDLTSYFFTCIIKNLCALITLFFDFAPEG